MTPEGKVKVAVRRVLDGLGAYYFMPVQTGLGARTLDFLVCYQGYFFGIETKAHGGKPTELQRLCVRRIIAAGGEAIVVDSAIHLEHWLKSHANPDGDSNL